MNEPNEERAQLSAERIDILATMVQTLRAELARVTAERDRALQTIALLQEQRDFWKDEGMRGFEPESAEECD